MTGLSTLTDRTGPSVPDGATIRQEEPPRVVHRSRHVAGRGCRTGKLTASGSRAMVFIGMGHRMPPLLRSCVSIIVGVVAAAGCSAPGTSVETSTQSCRRVRPPKSVILQLQRGDGRRGHRHRIEGAEQVGDEPDIGSALRTAPPGSGCASSTSTSHPASASIDAATRPWCPATDDHGVDMVAHGGTWARSHVTQFQCRPTGRIRPKGDAPSRTTGHARKPVAGCRVAAAAGRRIPR
jgi:hypothetical protein